MILFKPNRVNRVTKYQVEIQEYSRTLIIRPPIIRISGLSEPVLSPPTFVEVLCCVEVSMGDNIRSLSKIKNKRLNANRHKLKTVHLIFFK